MNDAINRAADDLSPALGVRAGDYVPPLQHHRLEWRLTSDGVINLGAVVVPWKLRFVEIGAQPVPFEAMKGLAETLPCRVSNIYGITEGGGGGTFNLSPEDVLETV